MDHWSDRYVGLPYDQNDCAVLAERVQREVFGRNITLPDERASSLRGLSRQIDFAVHDVAEPVVHPVDGDGVLMFCRGRLRHVGVYLEINGRPYVLHSMRNAGQVARHRVRDLPSVGLEVEGYYRWKMV